MMEDIKRVNLKNIFCVFNVTDPHKSKMAAKYRRYTGSWEMIYLNFWER